MTGVNQKLYTVINDPANIRLIDENLLWKLNKTLQEVSLKPFKKGSTLKSIIEDYNEDNNVEALVARLDTFLADNDLYRDILELPLSETIKKEHVQLICYSIFS